MDTVFDQQGNWIKEYRPQDWQDDAPQLLDDVNFRQSLQDCMQKLPPAWHSTLHLNNIENRPVPICALIEP